MTSTDRHYDRILTPLGQRVRTIRTNRGWTIRELAERAALSSRFLAQLEGGQGNISVARLAELADALDTTPAELLAGLSATPRTRTVALLGLRGAGKSTLGQRLAAELDVPFVELDALIEREAGLPLREIFDVHGESYFRRIEREVLTRFLADQPPEGTALLAVGGGLVTDRETFELLRRRARTVWLKATAEDHWDRVIAQGDRRPMAHDPHAMAELRSLLQARRPLYAEADQTIDTSELGLDGSLSALRRMLEDGAP